MTAVRVHSKIFLNNLMLNNSKSSYILFPQKCLSNHPLTRSFQTNVDNQNYPITVPMKFSGDLTKKSFLHYFYIKSLLQNLLTKCFIDSGVKMSKQIYFYLDHFKAPRGNMLANFSVEV